MARSRAAGGRWAASGGILPARRRRFGPIPARSTLRGLPLRGLMLSGLMLLGLLLPAVAAAEGTLRVRADQTEIELGETVTLKIRAGTDSGARGQLELAAPSLDDWNLVGQSESTRVDGFRGTRTTTITLRLQPKKAGTLRIDPFTLELPTGPIRSEAISVTVRDGGVASPDAPATPGQSPATPGTPPSEGPPDEVVFLRWEVDRDSVWLGQQIDARLYIYVREGIGIRDFKPGEIDLAGFWNEQHQQSRRARARRLVVGGLRFERQEVAHYTLFPLRAGERALPEVGAEMIVRQMRAFGGPRSLINRVAAPLKITVRPLPDGAPKGFAGPAVGRARLSAAVDQRRIDASQGVQLTLVTRIDGLIQNVPPVELPALADFKVFPAGDEARTERRSGKTRGVRTQSWLLRPNRGGRLKIPALQLPYFDPGAGAYRTARTAPITIQVTGEPGVEQAEDTPAERGPALRDIHPEIDPQATAEAELGAWFWAALFGAPLLFLLAWGGERLRDRRDATAGSRAARTAARDARLTLERIGEKGGEARAGYSAVARAIIDYLETRFATPFNGLTRDAMADALTARGAGRETIDRLLEELDACDFARFAPAADAASGLATAAGRAADAIDALEREVSR